MLERTPEASCPPHHWLVTPGRGGGVPVEHLRCVRCGAEKDIPWTVATRGLWPRRTPRRPRT